MSQFREDHAAFKVILGARPIPVAGAELAYVDFGHPGRLGGTYVPNVAMKGATAFAMFYLPLPVVEVFVRTNTSPAAGAGVQCKLGAFAVRGEYEGFNAAGGNPRLLSLGVSWAF